MRLRTMRRSSIVIALVAMLALLAMFTPASAAQGVVVTLPGSVSLGYLPKPVVLQKGSNLAYRNLDTARHDVRSTSGLFSSAQIGLGQTTFVNGANLLPKGTFAFYCTLHPNMRGNLRVI